jgi:hypothetical protein
VVADREADVDERLVVGLRRGLDRGVIGDYRADGEQRGDRRQQDAQQVRTQAAPALGGTLYLNSSSM